jgi:flagellar biosynthesis/type III secretory pathway ATPase
MPEVISDEHLACVGRIKDLMAAYRENEDLIQIGAYAQGTNERVDRAIKINAALESFLRQDFKDKCGFEASLARLMEIEAAAGMRKA